jgi:hypothetical protein
MALEYLMKTKTARIVFRKTEKERMLIALGNVIIYMYHSPVKGSSMLNVRKNAHKLAVR